MGKNHWTRDIVNVTDTSRNRSSFHFCRHSWIAALFFWDRMKIKTLFLLTPPSLHLYKNCLTEWNKHNTHKSFVVIAVGAKFYRGLSAEHALYKNELPTTLTVCCFKHEIRLRKLTSDGTDIGCVQRNRLFEKLDWFPQWVQSNYVNNRWVYLYTAPVAI